MAINLLIVVASVIACAVVGSILWWACGQVRSGILVGLISIGTALLGYIIYFAVQTVAEVLYPAARGINGHIIAYHVDIFTTLLVLIVAATLVLRKITTTAVKS